MYSTCTVHACTRLDATKDTVHCSLHCHQCQWPDNRLNSTFHSQHCSRARPTPGQPKLITTVHPHPAAQSLVVPSPPAARSPRHQTIRMHRRAVQLRFTHDGPGAPIPSRPLTLRPVPDQSADQEHVIVGTTLRDDSRNPVEIQPGKK